MKIAVLGANGRSGSLIVKEALAKGAKVSAFVRGASQRVDSKAELIKKDIFDLESADLKGFDVVVDAFGVWEDLSFHKKHIEHLAKLFKELNNTKLIVVGGAGSLYMDKEHKTQLMDLPEFPAEYMGVAKATAEVLEFLRGQDFDWTYLCPPADFIYEAPRSGKYSLGGEEFFVNSKGESKGSYADYALALVELAFKGGHKKERLSMVGEEA
ncbi:NADH-flavin reductase [Campylobacter sp. MIT 99-7217]|uniref:SDR family oxidoreductase n=1 Tax=Campylobacter sp. MIT 99-7217 TaxID=535091 RepID=UPI00115B0050|nr:NAD(P)H-binding protein [Campylobacter sp. MIT 99-7217]TQR34465.1 NADH-flavin reductase [Campylobacter sp. MIT 99-7217]